MAQTAAPRVMERPGKGGGGWGCKKRGGKEERATKELVVNSKAQWKELPILRAMNQVYESKKCARDRERRRKQERGDIESDDGDDDGDIYVDTLSAEDW